ncbi:hypothetical protein B0H17DRAFT_1150691 [Mycena rosella]|uniref:Uncharacterized protein n=1 Tax=Mycena rosella TaxID=1033263 RepID=A0AAD7BQN2_MYCRO|nr:hypothetical protein B0H17DRAFT_1150691 [Mycena rosella]
MNSSSSSSSSNHIGIGRSTIALSRAITDWPQSNYHPGVMSNQGMEDGTCLLYLLKTKKFMNQVQVLAIQLLRFITHDDASRQIRTWKAQLIIVRHHDEMTVEARSFEAYRLGTKITDLMSQDCDSKKALSEARYDVEGDTLRTTSWTSIYEVKLDPESNPPIPRKWQQNGQRLSQLDPT